MPVAVSGEINVGLMGLGVVGGGVAAALLGQREEIIRKIGRPVNLKKILVRDPDKPRESGIPSDLLTTNPEDILTDPAIPRGGGSDGWHEAGRQIPQ